MITHLIADPLRDRPLSTLVENRTTYSMDRAELHLFETHCPAEAVDLRFDSSILATMLQGRKVMHLRTRPKFNFLPGESIMLPPGERMRIDFPDATEREPTKCLALAVDNIEIDATLAYLNEMRPRAGGRPWERSDCNFHFTNELAVNQLLQRLIFLCAEGHRHQDIFVRFHLRELLMRVIEAENRHELLAGAEERRCSDPISAAISHARAHLDEKLSVADLSRVACMSESTFYRAFRNEVGETPTAFVNRQRLELAARLLRTGDRPIREVGMRCGFASESYFCRVFRAEYGCSPKAYR